jgi:hypothetical protein
MLIFIWKLTNLSKVYDIFFRNGIYFIVIDKMVMLKSGEGMRSKVIKYFLIIAR